MRWAADGNVHRGVRWKACRHDLPFGLHDQLCDTAWLLGRRLQGRLGDSGGRSEQFGGWAALPQVPFMKAQPCRGWSVCRWVIALANNQYAYSTPNSRQFACANLIGPRQRLWRGRLTKWMPRTWRIVQGFPDRVQRAREATAPSWWSAPCCASPVMAYTMILLIYRTSEAAGRDCLLLADNIIREQAG